MAAILIGANDDHFIGGSGRTALTAEGVIYRWEADEGAILRA